MGGTPSGKLEGGTPSGLLGVPHQPMEVPLIRTMRGVPSGYSMSGLDGVPLLRLDGVPSPIGTEWGNPLPCEDWMGVSPIRTGWGYPPHPQSGDREAEQLRGEKYTFCVHAGILSCYNFFYNTQIGNNDERYFSAIYQRIPRNGVMNVVQNAVS